MKFFFGGISLLAVTSLLLTFNGLAQGGEVHLQGGYNKTTNDAGLHDAGNAAPAEEGAAQGAAANADHAEPALEEANVPAHHYRVPNEDNVVDISKVEGGAGVEVKTVQLLEGAVKHIFTSTTHKPFTSIVDGASTVVKPQRDVSYPTVVRIKSAVFDFVMAEAKEEGFLHVQERVAFYKKYANEWKTAFGRDILNNMHRCSKNVTYFIGGENSEEDFAIEVVNGVTRALPLANVFIERVMYKNQTIFEFSTALAQTVVGITVTTEPKMKAELTLLYPLGGFQYHISYDVAEDDRLHSPSQASKTISNDTEPCPECENETAGAPADSNKDEGDVKKSGFPNTTSLVTLAVSFLMMLTVA